MIIQEGWWVIAQAINDYWVKARGLGHPHVNLPTQQPFRFDHQRDSPRKGTPRDARSNHQPLPHKPSKGQDCNRHWRDHRQLHLGRWHREEWAHVKINFPVFKDEDAKDAVTYQSWRWDLTVYQPAGCRDHTLLPYAIQSLQGYPSELVWSSSTDITLDDVLTILDEHYNNAKALDALNQELFQLWMADKKTVLDWGTGLSRHL